MGQALYRKYRSKTLGEVVGQEHITSTLQSALKSGKISHAYLFTGPRGTGKTSVARILAHEVNGLPYTDESIHLDIIEIDAASNRRIDEIRDLRDKVHISPTSAKYKVYIIDEVHMLTKEAFNALLKTLEEPPAHVIFILATTEAHKLPDTIISRTQRYSFKPIKTKNITSHLKQIAQKEKINIDVEALELIALHSDGGLRDSISLLDQAGSRGSEVTLASVQQLLGIAPSEAINELLAALASGSPKQLLDILASLHTQGLQAGQLAKQLGQTLRQQLVDNQLTLPVNETTELLGRLLDVPASGQADRLLEVILLEVLLSLSADQPRPVEQSKANKPSPEPETPAPKTKPEPAKVEQVAINTKSNSKTSQPANSSFALDMWPEILQNVKAEHNTLYSVLRMAEPSLENKTLYLGFQFAFHQKRINESKNKKILADIIAAHSSQPITVEAIVLEKPVSQKAKPEPVVANIETISSIFGGGEVLD
ncbi:MAG TPA: DNA polymerase III subunit gamma/tau [Patescibacteria group bacterium]|nr:DNA polymerase III subunit gamma/tau [Patescibacteria group bacterium]